jgi:hypothetical protein
MIVILSPPLNAHLSQGGLPYSFTHTVGDSIHTIGSYQVNWTADGFSSGLYFIRLTTDSYQTVQKLMLLK